MSYTRSDLFGDLLMKAMTEWLIANYICPKATAFVVANRVELKRDGNFEWMDELQTELEAQARLRELVQRASPLVDLNVEDCPVCLGTGLVSLTPETTDTCKTCNGCGVRSIPTCAACYGSGHKRLA